jgi:predicted Zn-dependent protease
MYEVRQGETARSLEAAQRVTQIAPNLPAGWGVLGYCQTSARKYDDAIVSYQRAIRGANRYTFAYEGLGLCYARTNRPAAAIQPLQTVLVLKPKAYVAATELGFCCLRTGQPDAGVKACRQAVAARPEFSEGWNVLGQCYQLQGEYAGGHALISTCRPGRCQQRRCPPPSGGTDAAGAALGACRTYLAKPSGSDNSPPL